MDKVVDLLSAIGSLLAGVGAVIVAIHTITTHNPDHKDKPEDGGQ